MKEQRKMNRAKGSVDTIKLNNIHIMGVPEERKEQKIYEEIMAKTSQIS